MSRCASIPSRRMLVLFPFLAGFVLPAAAATQARVSESYGKLPLHFEANRGQTDKAVRFLSRGAGYSLYLTGSEAVLVLSKPNARNIPERRDAQTQLNSVALRMSLVGAARKPLVSGLEEQAGKANYFIGKDPAKWRTDVPTYAKVHYQNVYPGIDLVYYGNQHQLEYDFVVAPGADPKKIVLAFKGVDKVQIDARGDLVLRTPGGDIRQHKPIVYQEIDGARQEIAGSYVRKGANRVGFKVASHDTSRPLIIDPVLAYSTYLGGSSAETPGEVFVGAQAVPGRFIGVAVDATGNAYVTGATKSLDFPTTSGAFQTSLTSDPHYKFGPGGQDAFVTKLNSTGSGLIYSTYLGGMFSDQGSGIAVDADGNAYVTGTTGSYDFPTTPLAFQRTSDFNSAYSAFVTKLNPSGSVLVYSTYLGGTYNQGFGIAVDTGGNAYVTGEANHIFPTTPGAFKTSNIDFGTDAFVTKLNPIGSGLVYSTFLGGRNGSETGYGIAVDAGGNIYVTGVTSSIDFPVTPGAFQTASGGNDDAFVTKLNPAGGGSTDLIYSTYLGGSGFENGLGIAVDSSPSPNAYVTGYTDSPNFPTTTGAFQTTSGGGEDAFVTKLNPVGSGSADLAYSTYLGGSGSDRGYKIAVDAQPNPNAYVTGTTSSTDFPTAGALQTTSGGLSDAFVTRLNPTASGLVYSTYLGGTGGDQGLGIAVDGSCSAYVTGVTDSSDFPITAGAFQPAFGGFFDAFVAKLADDASPCNTATRFEESAATYTGSWTTYGPETGTFSGGTIVASNQTTASATFAFTGTAVSWIGVRCNTCGIAAVSIDGGVPAVVDTFGPGATGSLTSEVVFSASGLAPGVTHTLVITVTGAGTAVAWFPHVAVDAFDVTR